MAWNKQDKDAFPARHPREPQGLRRDILDEIADHLACAADQEVEAGADETDEGALWARVVERFGDPDAMARRLWWDAMRETVMREWIQTGVLVVVGLAVVVFMALVMRQMNATSQAMLAALAGGPGGRDRAGDAGGGGAAGR